MRKTFIGTVVSIKMRKTAVVEVARRKPHPVYRKLLKRSTRLMADTHQLPVGLGDVVKIEEAPPLSRNKHFRVVEVVKAFAKSAKEEGV